MNPLDTLLADLATTAANASATLDASTAQRLAALNGRVLLIVSTSPKNAWTISVRDARINVEPGETTQPNVILQGSLAALFSSLSGTFDETLTIEGDEATLTEFVALITAFRPDLPEDLLGIAEIALQGLRTLVGGATDGLKTEMGKQFVNTRDRDQWLDRIDTLKLKVDRLAARTENLEKNRRKVSPPGDKCRPEAG